MQITSFHRSVAVSFSSLASVLSGLVVWVSLLVPGAGAAELTLSRFERHSLTDEYYSEGAGVGDINGDGVMDVVYGPHWYAGPGYLEKKEIYPAKPQPRKGYADNFFSWVYDFDGDGRGDVLVAGFPGTPAYVYRNPGGAGFDQHWKKHEVFDWVSNEAPQFMDVVGDSKPELLCTRAGMFGFVRVDWENPFGTWTFHPISGAMTAERFGHGLGLGDVNGDGLNDVLHAGGWFEQPKAGFDQGHWVHHPEKFSNSYGGAEMFAYDVDGDGDNDVITALAAHDFGLAWYEQVRSGDEASFREHLIMGARPDQNRYGVVFSELHSVQLADMDGDGLKDIVTGKTYYSHHEKSPQWNAGAVVYWFRLAHSAAGVDWVPYRADGEAGIGRQLNVTDVNADGLPDIVVGGMKGCTVLVQRRETVDAAGWKAAQPVVFKGGADRVDRGRPAAINPATGAVDGAIEGESMKVVSVSAGKASVQNMTGFKAGQWSGGKQLFWNGATPRARMHLEFEVPEEGDYEVEANLTVAGDYAIVNLLLDNQALGESLDLFDYPDVRTTGVLKFGARPLKAGPHRLTLETIGANESAVKAYMVGLDYLRLVRR